MKRRIPKIKIPEIGLTPKILTIILALGVIVLAATATWGGTAQARLNNCLDRLHQEEAATNDCLNTLAKCESDRSYYKDLYERENATARAWMAKAKDCEFRYENMKAFSGECEELLANCEADLEECKPYMQAYPAALKVCNEDIEKCRADLEKCRADLAKCQVDLEAKQAEIDKLKDEIKFLGWQLEECRADLEECLKK